MIKEVILTISLLTPNPGMQARLELLEITKSELIMQSIIYPEHKEFINRSLFILMMHELELRENLNE